MSTCMPSSAKFGALAESLNNGRMLALLRYIKTKVTASTVADASIFAIYKNKGDRVDRGSSRGISLLSVGGKILARVMLNRLLTHVAEVILRETNAVSAGVVSLLTWPLSHVCFKKNAANSTGHSIWH